MKVTGQNLWKIVERIDGEYSHQYAAYRYAIYFRQVQGYAAGSPLMVMVSEFLQASPMSVRDILAHEINKHFKGELPQSMYLLLDMPDHLIPPAWKAHDPFHAYKQKPGPGVQIWVPPTQYETVASYQEALAWPSNTMPTEAVDGHTVVRDLTKFIPGLKTRAECPVPGCQAFDSVLNMVQHLNDHLHQWSREKIADWLETLDVDLSFPAEAPEAPPLPLAKRNQVLIIIGKTYSHCRREADYRRRREGRDAVLVSEGSTPHRLAGLPKGGVQYVVLPGIEVDPRLAAELAYIGAVEVGDEESYEAPWSMGAEKVASSLKEMYKQVYSQQIAYQAESDVLWHKTFFTKKPPEEVVVEFKLVDEAPVDTVKALVDEMSKYYKVPVVAHDDLKDVKWLGSSAGSFDTPTTPETIKKTALESKKNPNWATFNQPSKNPFKKK